MTERSPFHPKIPQLQIAFDSTSLGLLKTCPRKYYYTMIEQWNRPENKQKIDLSFGLLFHSSLELFDQLIARGVEYDKAQQEVLIYLLKQNLVDSNLEKPNPLKTKPQLIRAVIGYLENFREDTVKTAIMKNGEAAVEVSFEFPLPLTIEGETISLSGHFDKIVEFGGQTWILDRKTTKMTPGFSYWNQFKIHNQIELYTLASQVVLPRSAAGVMIDCCQLLQGGAEFHRKLFPKSSHVIDEWMQDFENYLMLARHYVEKNYWPKNDQACGNYGGCQFLDVCATTPQHREMVLNQNFVKREWNPLKKRNSDE